jgi:hypothetical protein
MHLLTTDKIKSLPKEKIMQQLLAGKPVWPVRSVNGHVFFVAQGSFFTRLPMRFT